MRTLLHLLLFKCHFAFALHRVRKIIQHLLKTFSKKSQYYKRVTELRINPLMVSSTMHIYSSICVITSDEITTKTGEVDCFESMFERKESFDTNYHRIASNGACLYQY